MVKDTPDLPGFDRDAMWGRKDLLMNWHPLTDPRKPYPPAPDTPAEGPAPGKEGLAPGKEGRAP